MDQPSSVDVGVLSRFPGVPRRLLDVDEYHRMGEAGILSEDDRVELIEGELIAMSPIGSDHAGTVNALNHALVRLLGDRAVVAVQNPVRLDDHSEPQPDFTILKARSDFYRRSTPGPEDVLLVIEVANTSLDYDRKVKLALYARSRIPEVWIVNLAAQVVEVYRSPEADHYTVTSVARGCDTLAIAAIPDAAIAVSAILA